MQPYKRRQAIIEQYLNSPSKLLSLMLPYLLFTLPVLLFVCVLYGLQISVIQLYFIGPGILFPYKYL